MHDLAVHVKEGFFFCVGLLSRKLCTFLCFRLALLHSVPYLFFLYSSPWSLCTIFDAILFNRDEGLSVSSSANVFFFGDLNVHHMDELIYSG